MIKKLLLYLILFIFIITTVNAETFQVYSLNGNLNKCSCDKIHDTIVLRNNYVEPATFEISNYGTGAKLAKLNTKKLIIPAGQEFHLINSIDNDCKVFGDYEIKTKITNNFGLKKTITKKLSIDQCRNIDVSVSGYDSACVNEELKFSVDLTNNALFTDNVTVSVENIVNSHYISEQNVKIAQGEKKNVELLFRPTKTVQYEPIIVIQSIKSGNRKEFPISFNVEKCYDLKIRTDFNEKKTCKDDTKFNVYVENIGTKTNNASVTGTGNNVDLDIEKELLDVLPGETESIEVTLVPVESGISKFELWIGNSKLEENFEILSDYDCNRIDLDKDFIRINNNTKTIDFAIKNNGLEESDYYFYTSSNITYMEGEINIKPGNSHYMSLPINTYMDMGNHYINVYLTSDRDLEYQKTIKLNVGYDYAKFAKENIIGVILLIVGLIVIIGLIIASTKNNYDDSIDEDEEKPIKKVKKKSKKKKASKK